MNKQQKEKVKEIVQAKIKNKQMDRRLKEAMERDEAKEIQEAESLLPKAG